MTKVGDILSLCNTVQENRRANWLTLSYPAFLTWMAQDIVGDGLSYTQRGNTGYTPAQELTNSVYNSLRMTDGHEFSG
jgi:hypothetical protein